MIPRKDEMTYITYMANRLSWIWSA